MCILAMLSSTVYMHDALAYARDAIAARAVRHVPQLPTRLQEEKRLNISINQSL